MSVTMTRGRRLLIGWAMLAQAIILILVGNQSSQTNAFASATHAIVAGHSTELSKVVALTKEVRNLERTTLGLDRLIVTTLRDSKIPSEIGQSIEFQVCRATNVIAPKPGCRIPIVG